MDRLDGMLTLPASRSSTDLPDMHMTHERNDLPEWGSPHCTTSGRTDHSHRLAVLWAWAGEEPDPLTRLALLFWIEQAFWGLSWMNRYKASCITPR